jgi:predicted RNase H-like HicB family nuclease
MHVFLMPRLTAAFKDVEGGWIAAWIEEIPGVVTQGRTMDEARENLRDALEMVLDANRQISADLSPEREEEFAAA